MVWRGVALVAACMLASISAAAETPTLASLAPQLRSGFESWMSANNVPGLVWGVVQDGKLVHVESLGVQDLEARRPVTSQTRFRIASMSKAFTGYAILDLAAQGKLDLHDPVSKHVPEAGAWARRVTVADLLHHTAGFVTDDPWGDRQQPLPERDFTAMLKQPVPFSTRPGTRYEYSNFGYATLGRIIRNVSGQDYARFVANRIFKPLGMTHSGFEIGDVPSEVRANGYRWENQRWLREPDMPHGAFGAMGGVITTADDYAKWMAHLLGGMQDTGGPVVRAMTRGGGLLHARRRAGAPITECQKNQSDFGAIYAAGLLSLRECVLGTLYAHGGGYPGYGSYMLLIPERRLGLFAITNRTYSGPSAPIWEAATRIVDAGLAPITPRPVSPALAQAYDAVRRIWDTGSVAGESRFLAMNFLMDRSVELWGTTLAGLKTRYGTCDSAPAITATGAMAGQFRWTCTGGVLEGSVLLAPTQSAQIQSLTLPR